jgi:hypothetical protein
VRIPDNEAAERTPGIPDQATAPSFIHYRTTGFPRGAQIFDLGPDEEEPRMSRMAADKYERVKSRIRVSA